MKKFFLSLAVMLSAATMNVNAMRDSWVYEYVRSDLYDMREAIHQDELYDCTIYKQFTEEVRALTDEFIEEHGGLFDGWYILIQHGITSYYSPNLESACQMLQVLQTIKMEEEAEAAISE